MFYNTEHWSRICVESGKHLGISMIDETTKTALQNDHSNGIMEFGKKCIGQNSKLTK
jgi:hypothetical protein